MATASDTAVLTLSCPDQPGLVAEVAQFIHRHGGNITHADQHSDPGKKIFLQRVEWEMNGFTLPHAKIADAFRPIAERYGMTWQLHLPGARLRLALFVSKQAHCLYDLLARHSAGEILAEIPLVISNHPDLESVARHFGLDFVHLPVTPETKRQQEQAAAAKLEEYRIDLTVLARYMQILSPEFVAPRLCRIINIHHSFLPAFVGARPYHQAYERGVKIIGATAHYVTTDLDQGPIIDQDVVRISHRDSVADLIRKGRDLEKVVLARAVDLHLRNRVISYGGKTVVFV